MSGHTSSIHRLNALVKLLVTLVFIVCVVSFGRYDFGPLIPYVFYPTLLMAFSETPYGLLLKRGAVALPFCLFAGLSNLIFDTGTALYVGPLVISFGFLSFLAILFKTYLCVMAILLLVATTPMVRLTEALRFLRVPALLVTLFEMTYRYLGTLLEEASSMSMAYKLRGGHKKGIELKHMGSFVGQLLLRSFDRSERIYDAMKLRGYTMREHRQIKSNIELRDWLFFLSSGGLCILFRVFDITGQLNDLIGRLMA